MRDDRYDGDPVAAMGRDARTPARPRDLPMAKGLWLEEPATGYYGELVGADRVTIALRDFDGQVRRFERGGVFVHEERAVRLVAPTRAAPRGHARSASGSFHVADAPARVAREGRIFVEGKHDAELVEKVWGHDLRVEGVVVEFLQGADHLDAVLDVFGPSRERRVGVLLDHLVPGSKESRLAESAVRGRGPESLLVVGHPYVDVWQSVRPERLGLERWPVIPRGRSWKHGIVRALGWPADDQADIARAWQRILERVRDYRDLEPSFLGRVEELIDFVTA